MNCYDRYSGCVLATREVNASEVERFGILDVVPQPDSELPGRVFRVTSLIERPKADFAPSCYGIFGRYILEPGIFECIDRTIPGFSGELQITDSLLLYSQHSPLYAFRFDGAHYDAGDRFGFMKASIDYGLRDPELSRQLREYFTGVDLKLPSLVS
jgi:UTP--glucose-1-phosphate uridylyltransferase